MARNIIGSLLLVLYANVLPYACRLVHGVEWMTQYLPDEVLGYLFFAFANTIAAAPPILAWWLRGRLPVTWIVTFVTTTALLIWMHHDFDLASDAQAAIGLLVFPILAALVTAVVAVFSGLVEFFIRKKPTSVAIAEKQV